MDIKSAIRAVIESGGFEPVDPDFYEVDQEAIEKGYLIRKPGDQYGVTAKGRKLVAS